METREFKIKQLTEKITKGTTPSNIGETFTDEGIMFFRSELIGKSKYVDKSSGLLYISESTNEKLKRSQIKENDMLFSMAGIYLGKISLVSSSDTPANTNQAVAIIRFNSPEIDLDYVYYYMTQKWFNSYVNSLTAQVAQPNINLEQIGNLKLNLPNVVTQKNISKMISCYDQAIDNNNKRITLLEQIAQNLYKEWFVRFRFPGWQNEQYKDSCIGKIPETFSVLKQNEVISDYIGGGWGNDDESANYPIQAAVVRGADFPEFTKGNVSTCPVRFHKKSNYESRIISEDDIVLEVSGGTQEQPVGRTVIVTKERLERFDNKLICASFCKLIRLNKQIIAPFFYYYWMQFVYDTRIIDRYQLQSTGIINFKFEYFLRKGDVLLPPSELMWDFDSRVRTIHKQIENLAKANENLAKQRDLLLPRLMSGKLEVK